MMTSSRRVAERDAEHHFGLGAAVDVGGVEERDAGLERAAARRSVVPAWSRREPKLLHPTPTTDTCSEPSARVSMCSPLRIDSSVRSPLSRPEARDNYDGVQSVLEGVPMKVVVDYDACSSNAVCMGIAPEIFEVRDDGFMYVLNENPGPEFDERLREAVASCPNGALSLEE